MTISKALLMAMRAALFVICCEGAFRYWRWWDSLRKINDAGEFKIDILALALLYSILAFFSAAAFLPERYRIIALLFGDPVALVATMIALFPCWRIQQRYTIYYGVFIRVCIIITLVLVIFILSRYEVL